MLTIHHLNRSRSERIVWLAEELGLDYRIVRHLRDPLSKRSPPALWAINPLGKAPAIEDGELRLAESGAIVDYLLQRYGAGRLRPAADDAAFAQYLHWLHAAESTLMVAPLTDLLTLMTGARSQALVAFLDGEYATLLCCLQRILSVHDFVAGGEFTAADIMVAHPLGMISEEVFPGLRLIASLDDYPAVGAYLQRLRARPAWQRTLAQIGE